MNEDALVKRLAETAETLKETQGRLESLELAVSWLLALQPYNSGIRYISSQVIQLENSGKFPDVVAALKTLGGLVDQSHVLHEPVRDDQQ